MSDLKFISEFYHDKFLQFFIIIKSHIDLFLIDFYSFPNIVFIEFYIFWLLFL